MTEEEIRAVALALMQVCAALPATDGSLEVPVLDMDPDFNDLPCDHTEGTEEDSITQEAVLRLAKAAIEALDKHRAEKKEAEAAATWAGMIARQKSTGA